LFDFVRIKIL